MNGFKNRIAALAGRVRRRVRGGAFPAALLALLLGAALALNILAGALEERYALRIDNSFNALTTSSETTRSVLAELRHPVHVWALYARGSEDEAVLALLNRYAAMSPDFTWEQADVTVNPTLLTRFRAATESESLGNDCLIVWCEATDRYRALSYADFIGQSFNPDTGAYEYASWTYEQALTSAVLYVTRDEVPRVMILQGQGELDESAAAALAGLWDSNALDVAYFSLGAEQAALGAGDLLAVLSPQRDFTDDELKILTDFALDGGSILFTCDFSDRTARMPNYLTLLRYYGFAPKEGVVIAAESDRGGYYENNRMYLIPRMRSTEITAPMVAADTTTLLMLGSRAFDWPEEADAALETEVVLRSGEDAYLRSLSDGRLSLEKGEGDEEGPFALALSARRVTERGQVSRAFILGSSALLTSADLYAMTDAEELIIRVTEYLMGEAQPAADIVAKTAIRPRLTARSVFGGTLAAILLPMAVAFAAFVVLSWRRRL